MSEQEQVLQPTAPAVLARIRITFGKTANMRYVGNLDMHTVWERTMRRAGLPLAYTKGFSPHPRLQMAASLPLGASSRCELLDAWLENPAPTDEILAALRRAAPPGLEVSQVEEVSLNLPALQAALIASEFAITLRESPPADELVRRVAALESAPSLPREWRKKPYDLRPLIEEITLLASPPDAPRLFVRLSAREGATGRPEEVLSALGIDPLSASVERVGMSFRE